MKRIFFFSTPADIMPVLGHLEAHAPLKFIPTGILAIPNRPIYLHSSALPNPGLSTHETGSLSKKYLVSHHDTKNQLYTFKDDTGVQKWLLGNGDNEESVQLTLAGLWTTGTLLPGEMNTLHRTPAAQQLMRWFLAALREEDFKKVDVFWLGREALAMLKAGKRLVQAEQSPPEFDLKCPEALERYDAALPED